jgi:RNA polymerase sigma factor (sigma-70 family)
MEENNLSDRGKRDLELVDQALAGDQKAYAKLMSIYREHVFYLILKMVSNRDDAEDLTIEAFGKAFNNLEQYKPQYAFSTWLFRIASNNCIDFIRKQKKNKTISIDQGFAGEDGDEYTIDIEAEGLNPEEELMKDRRSDEMQRIVQRLEPKYRRLVELRYFEELSYEEISDELEMPMGTVKTRLFRARELMLVILKPRVNRF